MTDVPNLKGFVFVLKSSSNKPDHTLTILSQNFTSAEFASIQGTWQGDGPSSKDITGDITTQLVIDPIPAFQAARHGNRIIVPPTPIWITFRWGPNGMGGMNTLSGTLAPNGHEHMAPRRYGGRNRWRRQRRSRRAGRGVG